MDYDLYAGTYDAEYDDYRHDVHYYVKAARRAPGPALELGCGTGRVLLGLARAGCPVLGIEKSAAMLERLQDKLMSEDPEVQELVEVAEGDMTDFELDREFGLVYMPFREFMHLMKVSDQLACLNCVHRHLHPEGNLIINLYDFDLPLIAGQSGMEVPVKRQPSGDYTDPATGHRVLLTSASTYHWDEHSLHEQRFYDRIDEHGVVKERRVIQLTQRWFTRFELQHLFYRAGFRVVSLHGSYFGENKIVPGGEAIWVLRPATLEELDEEMAYQEDRLASVAARLAPADEEADELSEE
jgi:SAM-dependent methyltransferase